MTESQKLGLLFLAPAAIIVITFFLVPVVLTGVFAFTNMSTATGITSGTYMVTPSVLRELKAEGVDEATIDALSTVSYTVNDATLASARAAGVAEATVNEIADRYAGQTFDGRRAFERALKKLRTAPRSTRLLKSVAAQFESNILNRPFDTPDDLSLALEEIGVSAAPDDFERLVDASYTGWTFSADNFRRMFASSGTLRILINTLLFVFFTLILFNTGFALVLAITTHYLPSRQASLIRMIWFLPRITPPVLYVLLWKWLAWDTGFLSTILAPLGVESRNWMLDTPLNAWTFIILLSGFVGASFGMILFSSAIGAIPKSLFWASEVDGASRWLQVRRIILPLLRWPILFVTSYQTLSLLTTFELIFLATNGGPGTSTQTWSLAAYQTALWSYSGNYQYGLGAALALVLVIIGIILSLLYLRLFNFKSLVARPRIET